MKAKAFYCFLFLVLIATCANANETGPVAVGPEHQRVGLLQRGHREGRLEVGDAVAPHVLQRR